MKAIIKDKNMRDIETLSGYFKNGTFYYKIGGLNLGFIKLFATTETLPFDPEDSFNIGKETYGIYKFDGKNYIQVSWQEKPGEANVADYVNAFKLAELEKQLILKRPFDLKDIIQFLLIILLIIVTIANYYAGQGLWKTANSSVAIQALNKTSNLNIKVCTYVLNQTKEQTALYNATLHYYGVIKGG